MPLGKQAEGNLWFPPDSIRVQVIGQKIEMLMPPEIAVQHDGYLQRYLDTGERHIVGTAREVPVITKDGERLNCVYVKRNLYGQVTCEDVTCMSVSERHEN